MDIILQNVEQSQLPLIRELAKVLGIELCQKGSIDLALDDCGDQFIAELDSRTAQYEAGTARLLTLDELEAGARMAYRKREK